MATLLLVVIYLSFISLGVPDSLLGTAWPVLYRELGVPLSDLPDNVQEDVRAGMGFDDEVTLEKWLESVQS